MKRSLIIAFCVCLTAFFSLSAADFSIGLDGGYNISSNTDENANGSGYEYSDHDMLLTPYFSIMPSDIMEISFGVPLGYYKTESIETDTDGEETSHTTSKAFKIGGLVGAYFHLIREDHIHLSMGPEVSFLSTGEPTSEGLNSEGDLEETESQYDEYSDISFNIKVPVKLDYRINDAFGLRFGMDIVGFSLNVQKEKQEGAEDASKDKNTSLYILNDDFQQTGRVIPSIGLFINF